LDQGKKEKVKPTLFIAGDKIIGDQFSYMEEGRLYLHEQLKLLKDLVKYPAAGVSIHHMTTWYDLQD
jgi:hypothetical protein